MSESRKLALGAAMLTASNGLRTVVQLLVIPVLARLVGPEDYGLIALAMPIVLLAGLFVDLGVGTSLVREQKPTQALESSVFWFTFGLGIALALLLCALAWPLSLLFGQPRLAGVILALSPMLLLGALSAVPNSRISRSQRMSRFALSDIATTLASAGIGIYGASIGWGVWSLVAQQLVLWSVKLVCVLGFSGFRPGLRFDRGLMAGHIRFGLPLLGASLVEFLASNIDNVLVGALMGSTSLAFYAMSYQIMRMPTNLVSGPIFATIFPAFATMAHDRPRIAGVYLAALSVTVAITAPVMLGIAVVPDLIVRVVLGPRWEGMQAILACLAPAGVLLSLYPINFAVLSGLGRPRTQFRMALLSAGATTLGILGGVLIGIEAVAAGVALAALACFVPLCRQTARTLGIAAGAVLGAVVRPVLAALVMAGAVLAWRHYLPAAMSDLVELLSSAGIGGLAYLLPLLALHARTALAAIPGILRRGSMAPVP